jgi:penicillin-binding protein 1A
MTVVSPEGELLGVVGAVGEKNANRLMNFATKSQMPPGSSIKPLSVYAPALEEGLISWSTVFDDTPVSFYKGRYGYIAWPQNFPSVYSGFTDISTALAYSKNTVAVKVYNRLGAERAYDYLVNKLHINGIVRSAEYNGERCTDLASAPLALGQLSFGATLRDMTNAYTSFYDGNYHKSRTYLAVYDSLGNLLLENEKEESYVFSEQNAAIMTQLLENVVSYGTANKINLKYSVDTAGKTGTSGEDMDRWFIGYTPYYTAGIWCGYPERDHSIGEIAPTHLEIWDTVMKKIHREVFNQSGNIKNFEIPDGVVRAHYCRDSGKLFSDTCAHDPRGSRMSTGYFTRGSVPYSYCDRHILVDYDEENGGVINVGEDTGEAFEDIDNIRTKKVALLRDYGRDFPAQIYISDAQYIYRALNGEKVSPLATEPFFATVLPKGRYIGISNTKEGKQFNSYRRSPEKEEKEESDELEELIQKEEENLMEKEENTEEEDNENGIFDEE